MSARVVIFLSLALVPLSGCLAGVGTMTAFEGLDAASSHAQLLVDTDSEPTLVGITSIEPLSHFEDEDDNVTINTYADAVQGDGQVPGWAYEFCMDGAYVAILMASGLGVLADLRDGDSCDADDEARYGLTNYDIDSDEAAEILAANESWPTAQPDSVTFWSLRQEPPDDDEYEPGAYWLVETSNFTSWGEAAINAQSGEIAYLDAGDYADVEFDDPVFIAVEECGGGWTSGSSSGAKSPLINGGIHEFSIGGTGTIEYALTTANQIGSAGVELLDESGDVIASETIETMALGGDSIAGTFDDIVLDAGQYTIQVVAEAYANYAFQFEATYEADC